MRITAGPHPPLPTRRDAGPEVRRRSGDRAPRPLALLVMAAVALGACGGDGDPAGTDDPAAVRTRVAADGGEPVSGVGVELLDAGGSAPLATGATDGAGEAVFSGLDPGSYDVAVDPPGEYELADGEPGRKTVTAAAGSTADVSFALVAFPPPEFGSVMDIDGQTYRTIVIGTQRWMADNLRVAHFRNGDPIPEAATEEVWNDAWVVGTPAWVYYGNDPSNGEAYGKLYNDFAVVDPRGLCPAGWHVSTDAEWKTLETHLGMPQDEIDEDEMYRGSVAGPIKSRRTVPDPHPRWDLPNRGATNRTGFSALPNGFRVGRPVVPWEAATFNRLGEESNFWTSTVGPNGHQARGIGTDRAAIYRGSVSGWGFGVRCVEDSQD